MNLSIMVALSMLAATVSEVDIVSAGASLSLEPFKSCAEWCAFGGYGELLSEGKIVKGSERWTYLLCSRAAIKALKEGDLREACFLASWAAGYILRKVSLASAQVWRNDFSVISRLPPRYWDVRAPTERGEEGEAFFFCPPPEWGRKEFRRCDGEVRAFLSAISRALGRPDFKAIPSPSGWSVYDAWLTASWATEVLALELLDLEGVRGGEPKFASEGKVKEVFRTEARLQAWVCAVHFSYLAEASQFEAKGLDALSGGVDKLVSLGRPFVLLPRRAPEGARRAAFLLAVELREALRRMEKQAPPLWRIVQEEGGIEVLPSGSVAIVLASPGSGLVKKLGLSLPKGKQGLVAFLKRGLLGNVKGAMVLIGEPEVMPRLVDFSLDALKVPLWGKEPSEEALQALKAHWAGWKLLEALEGRQKEEAVKFALDVPFKNSPKDEEAFSRATEGLAPRGMGEFWEAILPLPSPGGEGTTWEFVKEQFLESILAGGKKRLQSLKRG